MSSAVTTQARWTMEHSLQTIASTLLSMQDRRSSPRPHHNTNRHLQLNSRPHGAAAGDRLRRPERGLRGQGRRWRDSSRPLYGGRPRAGRRRARDDRAVGRGQLDIVAGGGVAAGPKGGRWVLGAQGQGRGPGGRLPSLVAGAALTAMQLCIRTCLTLLTRRLILQDAVVHERLGSDTYKRMALGITYTSVLLFISNLRFASLLGPLLVA